MPSRSPALPPVFDTGGANMFYGQISGNTLSDEYFQRLPIRYRRIGRTRVYDFDDVVAYVKELARRGPAEDAGAEEASSSPTGAGLNETPAVRGGRFEAR